MKYKFIVLSVLALLVLSMVSACGGGDDDDDNDDNDDNDAGADLYDGYLEGDSDREYGAFYGNVGDRGDWEECEAEEPGDCYYCIMPPDVPPPPEDPGPDNLPWGEGGPYADGAPFNQKIGDDPAVHDKSEEMIAHLRENIDDGGFALQIDRWSAPVFLADAETRRYEVKIINDWECAGALKDVPIPEWARPADEGDGHMIVIDTVEDEVYEFWQACSDGEEWTASWAGHHSLDGRGIYDSASSRGSGFSLLGGLIWPHELERGRIDHALIFNTADPCAGGPVPPATESDGEGTHPGCIPEGALAQLDPDFDTGSLEGPEKIIARALQEYGMYLIDSGSGVTLYAVDPNSFKGDPYEELGLSTDQWGLWRFEGLDINDFRVLDSGPQEPEHTSGECPAEEDERYVPYW